MLQNQSLTLQFGVGHEPDTLNLKNMLRRPQEVSGMNIRKRPCKQGKEMFPVTWDILSLNRIRRYSTLNYELCNYKVAITEIQEARCRGGKVLCGDFTMRCDGNHDQSLFERGFMIQKILQTLDHGFLPRK